MADEESTLKRKRIGEILRAAGFITDEQLAHALDIQRDTGARLGTLLVKLRAITEAVLHSVLEQQLGVPCVDLAREPVDPKLTMTISRDGILRFEMLPLRIEEGKLVLALIDPFNDAAIAEARRLLKVDEVELRLLDDRAFADFASTHAGDLPLLQKLITDPAATKTRLTAVREEYTAPGGLSGERLSQVKEAAGGRAAGALLHHILEEALKRKASDVHIDACPTYSRVRFRIDGVLQTVLTPPARLHAPLVGALKELAGLEIAVQQFQEAHLRLTIGKRRARMQVSSILSGSGEKCTLRFERVRRARDFASLPFSELQRGELRTACESLRGLILVVGPDRSGKSTTARSLLAHLAGPQLNVLSLETELLGEVPGVAQIPLSSFPGGSDDETRYAEAVRGVLQQDPDVLFIDELKDREVTALALEAAARGQLIVSTMNTFDAASALFDLVGLGADPRRVANAVQVVVAQRMVRKVCKKCRIEMPANPALLAFFELRAEDVEDAELVTGQGCARCRKIGYHGLVPIFEVLPVRRRLRRAITAGARDDELLETAREHCGFKSMREDGLSKALRGLISLEELRRVAGGL